MKEGMHFELTRLFSDKNGESHFEKVSLPLNDKGAIGFLSETVETKKVIFRKVVANYDYDYHNAPTKQYIVLLDGEIEIETSLGEKRKFVPGEVLLVEDTEGKGHKTRNLKTAVRSSIFIEI